MQIYYLRVIIVHYSLCENIKHVLNSPIDIPPPMIPEVKGHRDDHVVLEGGAIVQGVLPTGCSSPNSRSVLKYEAAAGSITPFSDLAKE